MATDRRKLDKQNEKKLIRQNIRILYEELGNERTHKGFGRMIGFSADTVGRLINVGTNRFDHTTPIELAFQLRHGSLRMLHDDFVRYFRNRSAEVPALRQPEIIFASWEKTVAFAEKLKSLQPIFLYYWSRVDESIIANRCEFHFSPDAGIEFSFFNPIHDGPNSSTKTGEMRYAGHLRLIGDCLAFEVYSHEETPEPASGIGTLGTKTLPGVARGRMVGRQTRMSGENFITDFKFILLSKPQPADRLQTTDRIAGEKVPEPLASFFEEELG